MFRRNTVCIIGFLLGTAASHTSGLDLGAITVESYLNQPLRLRIEITQLGEVRLDDVTVRMASTEDFARFGFEWAEFMSSVSLRTQRSSTGAYVLLTSPETINVPYLSFVLETLWPNGRLLSEYTAVLDLPVYREESARPETSLRQPITGSRSTTDASDDNSSMLTVAESGRSGSSDRDTIEVSPSNTLIGIARQIRPNESVSLQQTMIAIQSLNPDAFAQGNINILLSGRILRLPTEQEILDINAASALVEVGRQNQEFAEVEPFGVPGETNSDRNSRAGRLSIVATDSDDVDASSSTSSPQTESNAELDRRIAELESELSVRQEEADRARIDRENLELRLADLDAQIEATQELIRLKDIQLSQLRESLALAEAVAGVASAEQSAQEASRNSDSPVSETPASPPGLLSVLVNNSFILFGALGLVVSLLVWVMIRRNQSVAMSDSRILEPLVDAQAEQLSRSEESIPGDSGSDESDSSDRYSKINDKREERINKGPNQVMPADNAQEPFFNQNQGTEADSRSMNEDNSAAYGSADLSRDDSGIDLDDFDTGIFDLDGNSGSVNLGRDNMKEVTSKNDDFGMPFDLSDSKERMEEDLEQFEFVGSETGAFHLDKGVEPDTEEGTLPTGDDNASFSAAASDDGFNDLDFFSDEKISGLDVSDDGLMGPSDEISVLSNDDETATKLELAYAYQKMGDAVGAAEILQEVIAEGNKNQITEAKELLEALQDTL